LENADPLDDDDYPEDDIISPDLYDDYWRTIVAQY
jgi:hypothetical protein